MQAVDGKQRIYLLELVLLVQCSSEIVSIAFVQGLCLIVNGVYFYNTSVVMPKKANKT